MRAPSIYREISYWEDFIRITPDSLTYGGDVVAVERPVQRSLFPANFLVHNYIVLDHHRGFRWIVRHSLCVDENGDSAAEDDVESAEPRSHLKIRHSGEIVDQTE